MCCRETDDKNSTSAEDLNLILLYKNPQRPEDENFSSDEVLVDSLSPPLQVHHHHHLSSDSSHDHFHDALEFQTKSHDHSQALTSSSCHQHEQLINEKQEKKSQRRNVIHISEEIMLVL